jgi:hypothetical protein
LIGLDCVLRLIKIILVISSRPEKWGGYIVTLACVTWFFYVLCDSRNTGPRFILSSARVTFLHPKDERLAGEQRLKKFKVFGGDRPWGSNPQPTAPEANTLSLSCPGAVV